MMHRAVRSMMFPDGNDVVVPTNDGCLTAQLPPQAAASSPSPSLLCKATSPKGRGKKLYG